MHGWMELRPDLPWTVYDVPVDPATRTRREEYWWAGDRLRLEPEHHTTMLDAATGYVPNWHVLPYIAANLGYSVTTIDQNPLTMQMDADSSVTRQVGDITALPYEDGAFDVVACISVLEHLSDGERRQAAAELVRVARHSLIVTADAFPGLADLFRPLGVEVGQHLLPEAMIHLSPPVYALYATKAPQ